MLIEQGNGKVDPLKSYFSQPPHPTYPPAPSRSADLPPGPPRTMGVYGELGLWYRRIPFLERCRKRYGTPFTLWVRMPPVPMIWFDDPDDIKAIFMSPADSIYAGDGSNELEHFFGRTGLAYMEEEEHLARRKVVNRSAHGDAAKRINAAMRDIVASEVDSWPRDELFQVWPHAHRLAIRAMFEVTFGSDQDEKMAELLDLVCAMMPFNDRIASTFNTQYMSERTVRMLAAIKPLGLGDFLAQRARADQLVYEIIEDRRQAGAEGDNMLSVMLQTRFEDGSSIPDVEIRDELMTTFLAGSASTTAVISWGLEMLAREPRVVENLRAEMESGDEDDDEYTMATIYELLRRKPPLTGVIPRTVMKPLEINGRMFPVGARLVPVAYLVHHNPSIYPEPYAFRPERFLEEAPGTYTWIPFGGGRRRCLGKAIAEVELKYVLRAIIPRFDLHAEDRGTTITTSHIVVGRPEQASKVALTERSKQFAVAT